MALICPNGHANDEGNRFCELCGAPMQQSQSSVAAPAVAQSASGTGTTSSACPVCGQENMPGTAFCDNCGSALPPPMPAGTEQASVGNAAVTAGTSSAAGSAATLDCPQCGTDNDPSNRFCDNCGATLTAAAGTSQPVGAGQSGGGMQVDLSAPEAPPADLATVAPTPAEATASAAPTVTSSGAAAPEAPTVTSSSAAAPEAPTVTSSGAATPEAPTGTSSGAAAPQASIATSSSAAAPQASIAPTSGGADRQQLEEQVRTQQQVVSQLEQTQATLGASTPPAIVQALDEARQKLAQAQSELQASAQPTVDPAEVALLEEQVRTQQQVVSQLEQTQATLGASTPPAIVQALDEARQKLAQAQSELQTLGGGVAPSGVQTAERQQPAASAGGGAPVVPSGVQTAERQQPAPEAAQTQQTTATQTGGDAGAPSMPSQPAISMPVAPRGTDQLPPTGQAQPSGPRFVTRDGATLPLPRTGREIVIGRDDPISGIHPEVDLTPHGGEAGGVSRRHAVLNEQNGQWLLTDLDSTNYTRIDGNRLTPDTPTPLQDGARVQFGRLEVDFRLS